VTSEFSKRIKEAKELVKRESVKKYIINEKIIRWVVVGKSKEYLVLINPNWCLCYDFQHNALRNRVAKCKHNIALQIAQEENNYDTFNLTKEEYDFVRPNFLFRD